MESEIEAPQAKAEKCSEETCPICLDNFKDDPEKQKIMLRCNWTTDTNRHCFHESCLRASIN